jgi:hypothetical protein
MNVDLASAHRSRLCTWLETQSIRYALTTNFYTNPWLSDITRFHTVLKRLEDDAVFSVNALCMLVRILYAIVTISADTDTIYDSNDLELTLAVYILYTCFNLRKETVDKMEKSLVVKQLQLVLFSPSSSSASVEIVKSSSDLQLISSAHLRRFSMQFEHTQVERATRTKHPSSPISPRSLANRLNRGCSSLSGAF